MHTSACFKIVNKCNISKFASTLSVFKHFQGPWSFYSKFKHFQRFLKHAMNPEQNIHTNRGLPGYVYRGITCGRMKYTLYHIKTAVVLVTIWENLAKYIFELAYFRSKNNFIWRKQEVLKSMQKLRRHTIEIKTAKSMYTQPLRPTSTVQDRLCQPAHPVENWRILLVQNYTAACPCWHQPAHSD